MKEIYLEKKWQNGILVYVYGIYENPKEPPKPEPSFPSNKSESER